MPTNIAVKIPEGTPTNIAVRNQKDPPRTNTTNNEKFRNIPTPDSSDDEVNELDKALCPTAKSLERKLQPTNTQNNLTELEIFNLHMEAEGHETLNPHLPPPRIPSISNPLE
jgi:hypothetical protein